MAILASVLLSLTQDPAPGWTEVESPVGGSRASGLWFDNRTTGYIGRGECQEGAGLFRTQDGGKTWEAMPEFAKTRVMDIRRGPDGKLYGGGWNMEWDFSAWMVDEKDFKPVKLFQPGNNAWTKVGQAENIVIAEDGQGFCDSLTGVTFAYRAAGGEFVEGRSFMQESMTNPEAAGWQIRKAVAFKNRFYACGSLINEPAMVFLPSREPQATYHFVRLELQPPKEDGELLDMHVWAADHMFVAGISQTEHKPLMYIGKGDLYKRESWEKVDFAKSGITYRAGIRATAVQGQNIVAVGDKVPTSQGGFILKSTDGGKTWKDITPAKKVGHLSDVWLFENGDIVAAGGGGEMWIYETK